MNDATVNANRLNFLNNVWLAYPAAEPDICDVATFRRSNAQASGVVRIAGRLSMYEGLCSLSSAGEQIELLFSDQVAWHRVQEGLFQFDILADGDVIAVSGAVDRAGQWHVESCQLLAPGRGGVIATSNRDFTVARSQEWQELQQGVRDFFHARQFTEALTPTLVASPGTEPYLHPFVTTWMNGTRAEEKFLPTSPEFHLKKMLVAGWTRLFEIKTCFRNRERGSTHQAEFQMLEWYRAYANLDAIADDATALITAIATRLRPDRPAPKLRRTTVANLFREACGGFELRADTSHEELIALARSLQIPLSTGANGSVSDSFDDVFFRLFLERIEPILHGEDPVLVRGYPPSQAALSRLGRDGFADRFEIYWRGLELANAFHELNDPVENERRFRADAERKREIGAEAVPIDEELVAGLYAGLPPSGGIALGLDRLFMAVIDEPDIAKTRAFPLRTE